MKCFLISISILFTNVCLAQDSSFIFENTKITLPEVIVRNNLDYKSILKRIKEDTTFYKAFRNLHIIEFSAYNNIRMLDKTGNVKASYYSKTIQHRANGCRTTEVQDLKTTGDFLDKKGNYNYNTGQMYASLFFAKGRVCGEDNIVAGRSFSTDNLSGMEKHNACYSVSSHESKIYFAQIIWFYN